MAEGCVDANLVLAFVQGALSLDTQRQVESHVDACGACRSLLADVARTLSFETAVEPPGARPPAVAQPSQLASHCPGGAGATYEPPLPPGSRIGRYEIVERIGAGGMGLVYLAIDRDLDRKVALKVLRAGASSAANPQDLAAAQQRLVREAQAMARLSHPNVVTVYEHGMFEGRVFVAMEYVSGTTLRQWLRTGARPWREVLRLFGFAGRGLGAAHARGVVHRDFKPDNVLIAEDGRVRVTDFGLARAQGGPERSEPAPAGTAAAAPAGGWTQTGMLIGTPAYMAPEQYEGLLVDARADQFSFCVALYEALFGEPPFEGTTMGALAAAVRSGRIPPEPAGSAIPPPIRRALVRGLSATRDERYPSMDALLAALGCGYQARAEPALGDWRLRRVIGSIGVVLGLLVLVGIGRAIMPSPRQPIVLASGQTYPSKLVLGGGYVFWNNRSPNGAVVKVPVGGGTPTVVADRQSIPNGITADDRYVYWATRGQFREGERDPLLHSGFLMMAPLAGGPATTLARGLARPCYMAVDETHLYWVNSGTRAAADGSVAKLSLSDHSITTLVSGQHEPEGLTIDEASIYWTNKGDGTVRKIGKAGGVPVLVASGQVEPFRIVVDSRMAYWINLGDTAVAKAPKDGGGPVTILAAGRGPFEKQPPGIAIDEHHLYWADPRRGAIFALPLSGGPIQTLTTRAGSPNNLVVDGSALYWTSFAERGKVFKLDKYAFE